MDVIHFPPAHPPFYVYFSPRDLYPLLYFMFVGKGQRTTYLSLIFDFFVTMYLFFYTLPSVYWSLSDFSFSVQLSALVSLGCVVYRHLSCHCAIYIYL